MMVGGKRSRSFLVISLFVSLGRPLRWRKEGTSSSSHSRRGFGDKAANEAADGGGTALLRN